MIKQTAIAGVIIFTELLTLPAIGQEGWLSIIPPVNQSQIETLSKDIRYQREFGLVEAAAVEKQLVNGKAPLDKWVRESAFDSAKECENYKDNELKDRPDIDKYRNSDEYKKYKDKQNRLEAEEEESFKEMERILNESKELDENALNVQREEIERFKIESRDRSKQSEAAFNLQMLARFAQGAARRCVPASAIFVQKP